MEIQAPIDPTLASANQLVRLLLEKPNFANEIVEFVQDLPDDTKLTVQCMMETMGAKLKVAGTTNEQNLNENLYHRAKYEALCIRVKSLATTYENIRNESKSNKNNQDTIRAQAICQWCTDLLEIIHNEKVADEYEHDFLTLLHEHLKKISQETHRITFVTEDGTFPAEFQPQFQVTNENLISSYEEREGVHREAKRHKREQRMLATAS